MCRESLVHKVKSRRRQGGGGGVNSLEGGQVERRIVDGSDVVCLEGSEIGGRSAKVSNAELREEAWEGVVCVWLEWGSGVEDQRGAAGQGGYAPVMHHP